MIIQGKPELGLQPHQLDAYNSIIQAYKYDNKASIIMPTGCGKSFIALQLLVDNKDKNILFMAPSNAIKQQMYEYVAKYIVGEEPSRRRSARIIVQEHFPKFKIMLYPTLVRVPNNVMHSLKPDIIIMDELHRTAAETWEPRINELIQLNPTAKLLGLTATPDRMDKKNPIVRLLSGKINYKLTLINAIKSGIVKPPKYVKCDYALGDSLDGVLEDIEQCPDEKTKKKLRVKYEEMRKIIKQADGIPELFNKYLTEKDGKYIVFCKDKKHMETLMKSAKDWFAGIDSEPEMYSVYSGKGYSTKQNERTIRRFAQSKSKHLKLLFTVDMLNEGLHIEDISGVIMARPTKSKIIYLQQLGRILSSAPSSKQPIVFDLVNNYLSVNLDLEINKKSNSKKRVTKKDNNIDIDNEPSNNQNTSDKDIDIFKIQGKTKEFLDLLLDVQTLLCKTTYLENARAIKKWIETSGGARPPSAIGKTEIERKLGRALVKIRYYVIKPYILKTADEREIFRSKHPEIDEILSIITWIDSKKVRPYLVNAREIKKWINKSGSTKSPSQTSQDKTEKKLGVAFATIKSNLIKPYINLESEEERKLFRYFHPEVDEVLAIINEIDYNASSYLINAKAIREWIKSSNSTAIPTRYTKDPVEMKLSNALARIRTELIKPYTLMLSEEERASFRAIHPEVDEVISIINEIDCNASPYLHNARAIQEWINLSGDVKPPSKNGDTQIETKLGKALSTIRYCLIKPYLDLTNPLEIAIFRQQYPEIDEVLAIVNEIDTNNPSIYLTNARTINEWVKTSTIKKLPSAIGETPTERKLGKALASIRQNLIKPYMNKKTAEEKQAFRRQHPEIDEILRIISELDIFFGNKTQKALAQLIKQDLEKREALQKAQELESRYEALLFHSMNSELNNSQEVILDE